MTDELDRDAELFKFEQDLRRLLTNAKAIGLEVEDIAQTVEYVIEDSDWTMKP